MPCRRGSGSPSSGGRRPGGRRRRGTTRWRRSSSAARGPAPAAQKLVTRTLPSAPWAMRVSSELPDAWLNSHAYKKVTATVVTKPIGWAANTPMRNNGACQPLMASAMIAVAPSRDRVRCSSGCAYPRKLGSSISGPPIGLTMCMPRASGNAYQGLRKSRAGAEAPAPTLRPTASACTPSGTATASAYQTQLTRHRISRAPMSRRPDHPSVTPGDDERRDERAGSEEAAPRDGAPRQHVGQHEEAEHPVPPHEFHDRPPSASHRLAPGPASAAVGRRRQPVRWRRDWRVFWYVGGRARRRYREPWSRRRRAGRSWVLWALAVAGLGILTGVLILGVASARLEPWALRVFLIAWIVVPYVLSGAVAWWRRPASRLGPLMMLTGFVMGLTPMQWSSQPLVHSVGNFFDMLPAALFLHVFLAFPSGRVRDRAERVLVVVHVRGHARPAAGQDPARLQPRQPLQRRLRAGRRHGRRAGPARPGGVLPASSGPCCCTGAGRAASGYGDVRRRWSSTPSASRW